MTSAVVASTTTNLASVAPFLLVTGLSALIFRELILTISFAILASLRLALTLIRCSPRCSGASRNRAAEPPGGRSSRSTAACSGWARYRTIASALRATPVD